MMHPTLELVLVAAALLAAFAVAPQEGGKEKKWAVHDLERPVPPVVEPGPPPADSVVLFDGKSLQAWAGAKGAEAGWAIEDGAMVVNGTGGIQTKQAFGSCQLHLEWAAPANVAGQGQGRGNSGVFLMSRYEVQVLDSFDNKTYADGQAASVYGQNPPLVNACRKPGEWQTYDIIFHRPKFADGKLVAPATVTVLHNGILVQDHFAIRGGTAHKAEAKYSPHADTAPLSLQDHGNPVRYRNIWLRPLPD
jgi:hypothetical protein